jgi:hypothetical protein
MTDATMSPIVRISGREPGLARLTSLVSGVVAIEQIDPSSINRMVCVTFGDGSTAWLETTQADIDAAVKMLDERREKP